MGKLLSEIGNDLALILYAKNLGLVLWQFLCMGGLNEECEPKTLFWELGNLLGALDYLVAGELAHQ